MSREQQRILSTDADNKIVGQMCSLREQGYSLRQIASEFGISHGYVRRILKSHGIGLPLKPLKPVIPRRPRNGQTALPDFQLVADFEARGLTVKDAWREYAKGCSKPYGYTHFGVLYRKWLDDKAEQRALEPDACADGWNIDDCSADEDHLAELYWIKKLHPRSAVHVLSGFNCSLKVRNDELVTFDTGEERSFHKVTHGLQAVEAIAILDKADLSTLLQQDFWKQLPILVKVGSCPMAWCS